MVETVQQGDERVEFTRMHELIYELRIEQVMSPLVISLAPHQTLGDAKEILRLNRISGAPVLENGTLTGIVSVEDIIVALENGAIDQPLKDKMTRNVITARADDTVVKAVNTFAQSRLGRLPVVDEGGRLVGIVTRGDIVRGLLNAIDLDFRQAENARPRASHVFEDLNSDRTSLTLRYSIAARDVAKGGTASSLVKRALARLGIDPRVSRRAAIASYEAEMNIVIHSEAGGELIVEVLPHRISIEAVDSGPGIADLEQAMQRGFSTAPDWVRELGFGAGMGLCNIQACADRLKIDTGPGRGTHLQISIDVEQQK